jgi:phospholipase C
MSMVISRSRGGATSRTASTDHTSILRMIEWRWKLPPLSVRDAHANNLAAVRDFRHRNVHAPKITAPRFVGRACPAA